MNKPVWTGLDLDTVAFIEMHFTCGQWDLIGRALAQSRPHPSWTEAEAARYTETCLQGADAILTGLLAVGFYKIVDDKPSQ